MCISAENDFPVTLTECSGTGYVPALRVLTQLIFTEGPRSASWCSGAGKSAASGTRRTSVLMGLRFSRGATTN